MMNATMKPLVSIALCTYNGSRFLREQLDSLLVQDYPQFEIVAVDDASSDDSFSILEAYARRDQRLKLHRNPHTLGFSKNFETVIHLCRGALIAPCDQDDVWSPHKLSSLQKAIGDAPMVYCDSELIDADGNSLHRHISDLRVLAPVRDPAALVFGTCVYGHAMLFRRELLNDALPLPTGMSHDQWLSCVAACRGTLQYCDEALVGYRQHGGALAGAVGLHNKIPDPPGHKLVSILEVLARVDYCALHASEPNRAFFMHLSELLRQWMHRPACIQLPLFLARHRARLFATFPDQQPPHFHRTSKYVWGLPIRRLIQPRQYAVAHRRAFSES
ncbi:MAG: glycosyltransferase [Nevskiaceae bacterium]|nr:MAG: glycosyltransferase [Nevskiaceae bacterium]TBR74236.1 MAG: glycosyltransferase [Nevskiaceae bacterium]